MSDLLGRVAGLLSRARSAAVDAEAAEALAAAQARLSEPLRVAVAGRVKAGKSTLLNALVGEPLAPTDAGECTRLVTWYRQGPDGYVALLHPRGAPPERRPFQRTADALLVDLGGHSADDVDRLEVLCPNERLADLVLIDTPGLASVSADVSARAEHALLPGHGAPVADAVVYLFRHVHARDARFLEMLQVGEVGRPTPLNAVGVLSRADEVGSCRVDALASARAVADRYEADPRLRSLCPVVQPVAGLLAATAATLADDETQALTRLAREPAEALADLLLTADRLATLPSAVPADVRMRLLGRFGLFGVRLAVDLLRRREVRTTPALADRLSRESGIEDLREVLRTQFLTRSRILKAHTALSVLRQLLDEQRCLEPDLLRAAAEEVEAGAHEFVEIRTLHLLQSGRLGVAERYVPELSRLLGAAGLLPQLRLGLERAAGADEVRAAAEDALARWRRLAENPLWSVDARRAAQAACRSCEGLLAEAGETASSRTAEVS